jgi:hypothetical protein|nr:MAG TPA: hypothetical protein [Caudoviricetes sp.]
MRVISQDGTMDFPYEMSIVWCEDAGAVLLQPIGETGEYQTFAKYSTEEKAKKAMEELRYAYMCHSLVKMGKSPLDGIGEKITMGLSGVFQFPKEEELE